MVLQRFGFSPVFSSWIHNILLSTKLSISINGKLVGFIYCKRGMRQGDLISLILFDIAEEALSRGISMFMDSGLLQPMVGSKYFLQGYLENYQIPYLSF